MVLIESFNLVKHIDGPIHLLSHSEGNVTFLIDLFAGIVSIVVRYNYLEDCLGRYEDSDA